MGWLENAIEQQRNHIEKILLESLHKLTMLCEEAWGDRLSLDKVLQNYLTLTRRNEDQSYRLLYVINKSGLQCSSNVTVKYSDESIIGQDLSNRPYLNFMNKGVIDDFILSDVYVDKISQTHCITALHSVKVNGDVVGFVAADFDLKDLPLQNIGGTQIQEWKQIKGDPSIRNGLFQQTRSNSVMDSNIDKVLSVTEKLVVEQGVFHIKLHFSSSRATLWLYNDPYRYRIHLLQELMSPEVSLLYAKTEYPENSVVDASVISRILAVFKKLREVDETIYLRAGSINIINGLVGLNFSCDGSHYMPAEEFLDKNIDFWFSNSNTRNN